MNKQFLRKSCLAAVSALTDQEKQTFSEKITNELKKHVRNGPLLSYRPFNNEVDITAFNQEYQPAYPVLTADTAMEAYQPQGAFLINAYGIEEPDPACSLLLSPSAFATIIVPIVGFDDRLYRLGHGKGFYDRYLAKTDALKIGVAYAVQELADLPHDRYDIPLDLIITEKQIFRSDQILPI